MRGLYVVFLLVWTCGDVFTHTTSWPPKTPNENLHCDFDFLADVNSDVLATAYTLGGSSGCYGCEGWYNNTLPVGTRQISTFNNLHRKCRHMLELNWVVVALKDDHPAVRTISEEIQTLPGCAVNDTNMECIFDVDIMVKKCDDDLIYYLKYNDVTTNPWHYCFDRIYINQCGKPLGIFHYYEIASDYLY